MTVPTTAAYTGPYYPNGVTVAYPFGFKVNSDSEVVVFYVEEDGTETIIPSADYTVALSTNDNMPGGTVTTAGPLADSAGKPLYIGLDPEFTQNTKFEDEGAFNQSILNPTFDAGALRSIYLRERQRRAFLAPFGENGIVLPRAAARANKYLSFAADGSPFLSFGTGADLGLRLDLASPTGGAMLGLTLGGLLDDAVKFITAAMAGIPDDGDEGADVTAELTALAATAGALNLPIQLGPRTYLTDGTPITFTTSVKGGAGTLIKSGAVTAQQHVAIVAGAGTTFESVKIDGNCSADPAPWNAGNYDSFTGNRGLKITASNVSVRDVVVENVRWAGFLVDPGAEQVLFENCTANRCRGNFGDGFIAMGVNQAVYINCRAYDYTRIGFVADAYGDAVGQYCKQFSYINCHAEYGHDASILYGGGESNMGFWAERSGQISLDNCSVKNMAHDGFVMTSWTAATNLGQEQFHARNCTAEQVRYGFLVRGIAPVPVRAVLEGCHVDLRSTNGEAAYSFSGTVARDQAHLINCSSTLRGAIVRRCSVRCGPGTVIVDGFNEVWADSDNALRDATDNYYGSVSHFNDATGRVVVRDLKSLDAAGTLIGSVYKFLGAAAATLDLSIERGNVRGAQLDCLRFSSRDVTFDRLGNIGPRERMTVRGGSILDGGATSIINMRAATKEITFDGVALDFSASGGYLYFYNTTSLDAFPKIHLRGCRLIKNFETAAVKYGVRVNGDAPAITTANANHIVFSDGVIVNTGAATANAAFQLDSASDAASKVHGRGNLKSSTLANVVNGAKLSAAASFEAWG